MPPKTPKTPKQESMDPIQRALEKGGNFVEAMTAEALDALTSNFGQAYGDGRLGDRSVDGVCDQRNIQGQGIPGEHKWRESKQEKR